MLVTISLFDKKPFMKILKYYNMLIKNYKRGFINIIFISKGISTT